MAKSAFPLTALNVGTCSQDHPAHAGSGHLDLERARDWARSFPHHPSAVHQRQSIDAFHERFGGTRLTYSPFKPGRPSGPRVRYQRSYSPRVVDGKIMTPADLRRLHKYMLEIEKVTVISNEMRAVVESEWPELAHELPLAKPQR